MRWTRPHRDALNSNRAAVLWAVVATPNITLDVLASRLSLSRSSVYRHLLILRAAGYVTWDDGKQGTLRATVRPTPPPKATT